AALTGGVFDGDGVGEFGDEDAGGAGREQDIEDFIGRAANLEDRGDEFGFAHGTGKTVPAVDGGFSAFVEADIGDAAVAVRFGALDEGGGGRGIVAADIGDGAAGIVAATDGDEGEVAGDKAGELGIV